jgi:RNA polymerase sigma-70 factor (ECF subfamily)
MDDARFREEYELVSNQLYTFLVRTAGDPDVAADVLQEAAFKAYRSRRRFRGESTFKTWIYRIAMNTMKNHWARLHRERKGFDAVREIEVVDSPSPEKLFTGKEEASELSRSLMLLEEGYRVPFILKHVDGLSYREISEVLGIAENAARVRVHRARHALKKMLREETA